MSSRAQPITITYVAWDNAANAGKAGDANKHALKWVKDGVPATPTNAPVEVDAAAAPGLYALALTAAEATADVGTLAGTSSTAGVVIIPATIAFERLPTAAPGQNGGLPTVGEAGLTVDVQTIKGQPVTVPNGGVTLPAAVGSSNYAGGPVASVTAPVTVQGDVSVGTVKDKTGYQLAENGLDQIPVTDPGGNHNTFAKMMVAVWRRWYRKTDVNGTQLRTYADNGTTVNTTQAVGDDGATQTVGAAV